MYYNLHQLTLQLRRRRKPKKTHSSRSPTTCNITFVAYWFCYRQRAVNCEDVRFRTQNVWTVSPVQ